MAPNECLGEITVFQKSGGQLTKRLELRADGKIDNDSENCRMARGAAHRKKIGDVRELANLINATERNEAYALGRIEDGYPDHVRVAVDAKKRRSVDDTSLIARTKDYLVFKKGEPGLVLLDVDLKGMPDAVKRRVDECGGVWGALCAVLPKLKDVARVERASTSSELRNKLTGEPIPGSGGMHIYIPVTDAGDIDRFLKDFHDRLWRAGFGWGMVSAAGSFLERLLIDKSVGSPERLIFEAPPDLDHPLVQDKREATAHDGNVLDTRTACPPLTDDEKAEVQKLKDDEAIRLLPEREAKRAAWSAEHIARMIAGGLSEEAARAQVNSWIDRQELSGDFPLVFTDAGHKTVADVLATPETYIYKTLADPFEGPKYGRATAILYPREDGSLWIKSFAHGGMNYDLQAETNAGLVVPRGFKLNDDGLWSSKPDEDARWISDPFTVEAETSDDNDRNHGLLLKWNSRNGEPHTWAMPIRLVHADGNAIAAELHDAGLRCNTSRQAHDLLKQFFGAVIVERRVRCVDRAGWHGTAPPTCCPTAVCPVPMPTASCCKPNAW